MTKFCPNCGTPHECAAEILTNVEAEETKRVRIQADRDMEIARINAGAAKAIAETEADSEADHLEGVIEGAELITGADGEDGEPGGEPVIVQVDSGDTEEDAEVVEEPPVVEPVPVPSTRKEGWWGAYR